LSVYKLQSETCEDGCIRPQLFLSEKIPKHLTNQLEELGYVIRKLAPYKNLEAPVASHPDMILCLIDGKLFVPQDYYVENRGVFDGVSLCPLNADVRPKYPMDVRFNALIMNGCVYGRTDVICDEILKSVNKYVFVKQGYAACSTLVLSQTAAVTADRSIAEALLKNGIDVCTIEQGHIALEGYDCGFIGGASVRLNDNTVAFFGDIKYHPDHDKISEFAKKHNVRLISLSDEPLCDFGGGKCCNI